MTTKPVCLLTPQNTVSTDRVAPLLACSVRSYTDKQVVLCTADRAKKGVSI